ncbi:hypothetical protein Tco_0922866 [Tanacetum coccineum]|uniref:Uncharacterized protein n=1 Tax=Tanacetum coccineum TaxID=301880 RepID=A0ABQ5D263_9ASTR
MTRSSTESKTSLTIAANLFELELKKILIKNMESNKSINKFNEQKNLYKALVDAYESDKLILDTYGDTISFKIRRDDEDKDEEPSAGSNRGSQCTPPRIKKNSYIRSSKLELLKINQLMRPLSLLIVQPWLNNLAREEGPRESFDELIDTPLDFSPFMMTRLKVDILTPELLVGLTFELMMGTCKSLVELEYFFKEVYKATTDQLDWNNPEGIPSFTTSSGNEYGNLCKLWKKSRLIENSMLRKNGADALLSLQITTLGNTSNQLKQEELDSSQYWKPPAYYSDDDDAFYSESIDETPPSDSITPDLPITDSLVREDEHFELFWIMDFGRRS